ncbi:MAG: hypothetical protein K6E75_03620 [Lachnospiraceae bacterium]|nr:hypothetical protein [Lachnospiraceae bacterium]
MDKEYVTTEAHAEAMKRLDAENNRQNHRIDALEKNIQEIGKLTTSVEKLALSIENMAKEQNRQGERLEELEGRDGEMWRKVVSHVIMAALGIAVGYLLKKAGIF